MAVEQSGGTASPRQTEPAAAAGQAGAAPSEAAAGRREAVANPPDAAKTDPQDSAKADLEELKRKFREALERKRRTHATAEGAQDTGKVHGSHGPAASRRTFRRKSGG